MLYVSAYSSVQVDKRRVEKEFTKFFKVKAVSGLSATSGGNTGGPLIIDQWVRLPACDFLLVF